MMLVYTNNSKDEKEPVNTVHFKIAKNLNLANDLKMSVIKITSD